jgi:predicted nuclease of predicted toxin-antitoxin system
MARLYADEQFPRPVLELLRELGHDVLTVQESGNAGFTDPRVLAFATANYLIILTQNRRDFKRLHQINSNHQGIILCTEDRNAGALTTRIHEAILGEEFWASKMISIVRPAK